MKSRQRYERGKSDPSLRPDSGLRKTKAMRRWNSCRFTSTSSQGMNSIQYSAKPHLLPSNLLLHPSTKFSGQERQRKMRDVLDRAKPETSLKVVSEGQRNIATQSHRDSCNSIQSPKIQVAAKRDFDAPICSQTNVSLPRRKHSIDLTEKVDEEEINTSDCQEKTILKELTQGHTKIIATCSSSAETVTLALKLSAALEHMGLFDEEETHCLDQNDPLNLRARPRKIPF